jgi:hypothetical protein
LLATHIPVFGSHDWPELHITPAQRLFATHKPVVGSQVCPEPHMTPAHAPPLHTPFTHVWPIGQVLFIPHALAGTQVPAELQTSIMGHGAFGPHWLMVAWQLPFKQLWPLGQSESVMQITQAPPEHIVHVPFTQTSPLEHGRLASHCGQPAEPHAAHAPVEGSHV